jgi:hypothetical protein
MIFTIVILCETLEDAMKSNEIITESNVYQKMFIFYGEEFNENKLSWINKPNFYFIIPEELDKNKELVAIRAGLLLPSTLAMLCVKANEIPSLPEIQAGLKQLTEDSLIINSNFWGVRKEFIILNGLEGLPVFQNDTIYIEENNVSQHDIRTALTGEISTPGGVAQALLETIPLKTFYSEVKGNEIVNLLSRSASQMPQLNENIDLFITDNLMGQLEKLQQLNSKALIMFIGKMDDFPQSIRLLRRLRTESYDYLILNSNTIQALLNLRKSNTH